MRECNGRPSDFARVATQTKFRFTVFKEGIMKKYLVPLTLAITLLFVNMQAQAALSWFSRANCQIALPDPLTLQGVPQPPVILNFNESISWDWIITSRRLLFTWSHHNLGAYANQSGTNHAPEFHSVSSNPPSNTYVLTWRSYAGDLNDDLSEDWWVHGNHWLKDQRTGYQTHLGNSEARDCNLSEW